MGYFRFRWSIGSFAHIAHRLTGIVLALYIFVHLYVLGHLRSQEEFQQLTEFARSPWVKALEAGLLAAVAAHALNGMRITLLELGLPSRHQKPLAIVAAVGLAGIVIATLAWGMG